MNKKWAQNAPKKDGRKAPIRKIPSFVLRQDGCELSYEIVAIIAKKREKVKQKPSLFLLKRQFQLFQRPCFDPGYVTAADSQQFCHLPLPLWRVALQPIT